MSYDTSFRQKLGKRGMQVQQNRKTNFQKVEQYILVTSCLIA